MDDFLATLAGNDTVASALNIDCAGVPNGGAVADACGICNGDGISCASSAVLAGPFDDSVVDSIEEELIANMATFLGVDPSLVSVENLMMELIHHNDGVLPNQ
eukprot:TRINITY_DN3373_c0_g1_i1.p2 TRINITY_DN3373_c0_g1~~TRINITY_DN3373_c0_g1_i1.p2  ORF type:complete len:103 (-),score=18.04 TRINITY_DN3373_c0_g1_i1:114-422(-)